MVEAGAQQYNVPFAYKKIFNPEECTELVNSFKLYDKDKSGEIERSEFNQLVKDLGYKDFDESKVNELLSKTDLNKDGKIEWMEFVELFTNIKQKRDDFGTITEGKQGAAATSTTSTSQITYLVEERNVYSRFINYLLAEVDYLKDRLPFEATSEDLFHVCSDGLIIIALLNKIDENLVDIRTVNLGNNISVFKVRENLQLALTAARGQVHLTGVNESAFLEKKPHMIMGVIWQLIQRAASTCINMKDVPEIWRLAKDGEEVGDLIKLPVEQIISRWVNFHLEKSGTDERVKNLGKDLADSKALIRLLNQLDKENCTLEALDETDDLKRAEKMLASARAMGVPELAGPEDILKGNSKVNTLFLSEMFNVKHGLEELTAEEYEAAGMIDDDIEGSREERAYRLWINSLNIEGLFVNNLYEEARDGMLLLKVIHRIDDKAVEWNRVEKNAKNNFQKGINHKVAMDAMNYLKLSLVGVGGDDIQQGNRKLILTVVWQLVRLHYLQIIGSKTENQLLDWANSSVADLKIANFRDKSLADSRFLIKLAASIEPRVVNWDLVTAGETDEDKEMNAKYCLSIARKLGAIIFCVWDDIPAVNYKMILVFVSSLYELKMKMAE